ncbi:hypothetical protein V7111_11665 [Neobacillus niacini]|uniref:hypothetical protein n=1 Tax=Neobacillus niacini TaxID=86668 RepID=UPI002FFE3DA1
MITTPSQTNGLNQLSRSLYTDGSAIVNTMIQTSGAIGTAVAVSILHAGQRSFLSQTRDPSNLSMQVEALIAGIQDAFIFASIVAIIVLFCSCFIKLISVGAVGENNDRVKDPVIKKQLI